MLSLMVYKRTLEVTGVGECPNPPTLIFDIEHFRNSAQTGRVIRPYDPITKLVSRDESLRLSRWRWTSLGRKSWKSRV